MPHYRVTIERHEAGDLVLDVEAPDLHAIPALVEGAHPGSHILSVHELVTHATPAPAPAPEPTSVTDEVTEDTLGTQLDA